MSRRNLQHSTEVNVTEFTKKGHGLGVTADEHQRLVEVPFSLPGDKVQACLYRKKNGIFNSKLEEIINPSPLRIESKCIHFGVCGGCRWQHLSYEDQLKVKQNKINSLFTSFLPLGVTIAPIVPCNPPWEYRNKMEFTFSGDASENKYLGLIIDSSRGKVLNLTECHLVNPWFIQALKATRSWWGKSDLLPYHPHANKGSLRTLIVREGLRTGDRLVMLTVSGCPEYALNRHHLEGFVSFLRDAIEPIDPSKKLSIFLRIQQAVKGVETSFYEMLLYGPDHIRETLYIQTGPSESTALNFDVSPSAFFQPNTQQSEKLYSLALQLLNIPLNSVVYDLYCGTGTLGICAAKKAKQVIGIEISAESSLDARTNAIKNHLPHVKIITGSVREMMTAIRQEGIFPLPDVVMVDPPRMGLDPDTLKHLAELNAKKLLYISCNPVSQAENLVDLIEMGYQITAVQPVDQFPHTVHIENIIVLEKA